MRVLIIEDEQQSVEITSGALRSIDGEIEIVGSLPSIKASVDWLRNNPEPDLILCDVRLEDGESFEILHRVRVSAPVGFITAYDEYAREAFRMHGLRYLTKPLQIDELRELVQVVRDRINPPQPRVRLTLACEGEMRVVQVKEIGCIMSENGGVTIVMENGGEDSHSDACRQIGGAAGWQQLCQGQPQGICKRRQDNSPAPCR